MSALLHAAIPLSTSICATTVALFKRDGRDVAVAEPDAETRAAAQSLCAFVFTAKGGLAVAETQGRTCSVDEFNVAVDEGRAACARLQDWLRAVVGDKVAADEAWRGGPAA